MKLHLPPLSELIRTNAQGTLDDSTKTRVRFVARFGLLEEDPGQPQVGNFGLDNTIGVGYHCFEENALMRHDERLKTPHFGAPRWPLFRQSHKAENLMITKGNILRFSLPKPENLLITKENASLFSRPSPTLRTY